MEITSKKSLYMIGLLLVFAVLLGTDHPSLAADITVTTTSDVRDAGDCVSIIIGSLPGPDGVTSLREAMCAANNNPGPDTIQFNIPGCESGCTIQPTIRLPLMNEDGTTIDGYSQPGASPATSTSPAIILIEIDGTNILTQNGFNISSNENLIRGLAINRFPAHGVFIYESAQQNTITGNHIGLTLSGFSAAGNGFDGVFIGGGAYINKIGGDEPAERNIISCNGLDGVGIHGLGTSNNFIMGNYIGTTADGLTSCGNTNHGVYIYGGAQVNKVGDNDLGGYHSSGKRNLISGNHKDGIRLYGATTTGNNIAGNFIGVDVTGMAALPNGDNGISIQNGSHENRIGGDAAEERNIISGNGDRGIFIYDSDNNEIVGNFIGPDSSGLTAIPNGEIGIYIVNSNDNSIGYELEGNMNFISGNPFGVYITGDIPDSDPGTIEEISRGNWIRYNAIGLNFDGEPLGNTYDGVHLSVNSQQNKIGPNNWVAYNGDDGVGIDTPISWGNRVYENYIFSNDGEGIHLTNGANSDIDPPVIHSAPTGPGTVTGVACSGCTVELFFNRDDDGEGMAYFDSVVAEPVGSWAIDIPYINYPYLTATATDTSNNTSEFSDVYTMLIPIIDPSTSLTPDRTIASPGEILTYTLTMTNTGTASTTGTYSNTIPSGTSWIGDWDVSAGTLDWQESNNRFVWTGTMEVDTPIIISYQVRLNDALENGYIIENSGLLGIGYGMPYTIDAEDVTVVLVVDDSGQYLYLPLVLNE